MLQSIISDDQNNDIKAHKTIKTTVASDSLDRQNKQYGFRGMKNTFEVEPPKDTLVNRDSYNFALA